MSKIKEVTASPFHPLYAALARTNREALSKDPNQYVALVNFAEKVLREILNRHEIILASYKDEEKMMKEDYKSMNWFSSQFLGKLYVGWELRGHYSNPPNEFISIANIADETRQNIRFQEALELLKDAQLIELKNDKYVSHKHRTRQYGGLTIKITDQGKEYLSTVK